MIWLTQRLSPVYPSSPAFTAGFTLIEIEWVKGNFRKVVCQVNSLEDLMKVQQAADDSGIINRLVYDAGLTEFGGLETVTALAIGPDLDDNIDPVTKDLRLY